MRTAAVRNPLALIATCFPIPVRTSKELTLKLSHFDKDSTPDRWEFIELPMIKELVNLFNIRYTDIEKGNEEKNEPDGLVIAEGYCIGVEVTGFADNERVIEKAKAIRSASQYLRQALSDINSPFKAVIDGYNIPLNPKKLRVFLIECEKTLRQVLLKAVSPRTLNIDNISISIHHRDVKEIVEFVIRNPNKRNEFVYQNSVIEAINRKIDRGAYSTTETWLLLKERVSGWSAECDFNSLHIELSKKVHCFNRIFILTNARNNDTPHAIEIFPDKLFYRPNKIWSY
jgi:hypothetical protein